MFRGIGKSALTVLPGGGQRKAAELPLTAGGELVKAGGDAFIFCPQWHFGAAHRHFAASRSMPVEISSQGFVATHHLQMAPVGSAIAGN